MEQVLVFTVSENLSSSHLVLFYITVETNVETGLKEILVILDGAAVEGVRGRSNGVSDQQPRMAQAQS